MPYVKILLLLVGFLLSNCHREQDAASNCTPEQERVEATLLKLNTQKGITVLNGNPFCGTAVLFQDSILVASTVYKAGKRHGLAQKWFTNGQLSYEAYYKQGRKEGTTKTWWKNGNQRSQSQFKAGTANGLQLSWYRSGAKFKAINLVDGKEEGLQKAWRENGKIYNNYEAKNGRIFGLKRAALCYELEEETIQ